VGQMSGGPTDRVVGPWLLLGQANLSKAGPLRADCYRMLRHYRQALSAEKGGTFPDLTPSRPPT
jgi:hypothetical protein